MQLRQPHTCTGPKSGVQCVRSLQGAMLFVVRTSVGSVPYLVLNGIKQGCNLLPLAPHSLHAVHLQPRNCRWSKLLWSCKQTSQPPWCVLNWAFPQWPGLLNWRVVMRRGVYGLGSDRQGSNNKHSKSISIPAIVTQGPAPGCHCLALEPNLMVQPPPGTLSITPAEDKESHSGSHISH